MRVAARFRFHSDRKNPKNEFNFIGLRLTTHQYGEKIAELIVSLLGFALIFQKRWGNN